jgi:hypothetical protein
MGSFIAEVRQDRGVRAAGVLQSVCQNAEAKRLQLTMGHEPVLVSVAG